MIIFRPTYKDKATGETRSSNYYYLRYKSARYPLGVSDRRLAEAKAKTLIANLEIGFDPQQHDRSKSEHIARLILNYTDAMDANPKQQTMVRQRLQKVATAVNAKTLVEFSGERVQQWLRRATLAKRTKSHYRVALRAFGKWLVASGHAPRNPFETLEQIKQIETDRRLVRRALAPAELELLISTTEASLRTYCKLRGPARAMVYRLVVNTGLRRNEVASLRPSSFNLKEGEVSTVEVAAAYTKNKMKAVLPLPTSIVPLLRDYLRDLPADRVIWPVTSKTTGKMIHKDLEEAGIPVKVGDAVYDFHALRGQYATRLVLAGVPLAQAQKLLRHSTPVLTANVYTHLGIQDLSKEVEKL